MQKFVGFPIGHSWFWIPTFSPAAFGLTGGTYIIHMLLAKLEWLSYFRPNFTTTDGLVIGSGAKMKFRVIFVSSSC